MFSAFEFGVARRYLRSRKDGFISIIAWFSLIGIALGVATLIIVMSVMNGFRAELINRILGINGHVNIQAQSVLLADYDRASMMAMSLDHVVAASPLVDGQAMIVNQGEARGTIVRGIRAEDLATRPRMASSVVSGDIREMATDGVVIGHRLARRLGVGVGDDVTLISPQGRTTPFGRVPLQKAYPIVAIFDIGMFEYDSGFVFMSLDNAQRYFRTGPEHVHSIELFVDDPNNVPEVKRELREIFDNGVRLYDWQQSNASFFNALAVERNVMFLILTLIILVAAFNIISTLIMLVKDKGGDIAILRTMGATRGSIMRIFFLCGSAIGVMGTLIGFTLGLAFCLNIEAIRQVIQSLSGTQLFDPEIYFLSQLPAKVDPTEVVSVVIMALVLSLLATVYPAWRASRVDPVEALRYE